MEFFVVIVLVYVIAAAAGWLNRPSSSGQARDRHAHGVQTKPSSQNTYRPSDDRTNGSIKFRAATDLTGAHGGQTSPDLSDINDAFTGRRIDLSQPIYECVSCHVFYQAASVVVLREANHARCMVCGSTGIAERGKAQAHFEARNYVPEAVTLNDYPRHIGHVITFTGFVYDVKQSRRGVDYAVMFEQASWTKGLKMVAFKGGVRKLGGAAKLRGYRGKTLTIRGLLINDPVFGPEIIVDDPSMIIGVR